MSEPISQPEHYKTPLLAESQSQRVNLEKRLSALYAALRESKGVARLKIQRQIERMEQTLEWQGANPKVIDLDDLREHIQNTPLDDVIEAKYQRRVKNRASAIRAYCVSCQGGSVVDVRMCASVTCPLHPFRMGTDPLRGYDLPKAEPVVIEDDETDEALFEEGDDADDKDDTE